MSLSGPTNAENESSVLEAVLSDAVTSVSLLARIPQSTSQAAALASSLERAGHVTAAAELESLAAAESLYREAMRACGGRRGGVGAPDVGAVSDAARALARALRSSPAAAAMLGSTTPSARVSEFGGALRTLGDDVARRLKISKAAADEAAAAAAQRSKRVAKVEANLERVRTSRVAARVAAADAGIEIDHTITRLTAELTAAARGAQAGLQAVHSAASARLAAGVERATASAATATATQEKLAADLKAAIEANTEAEAVLRKRIARARLELETAEKEYETGVGTMVSTIAAARAQLSEERPALADFVQYFNEVDVEKTLRDKEAKIRAREVYIRTVCMTDFRYKVVAKKIQKCYKNYITKKRAAIKAAAKGKGKGKK